MNLTFACPQCEQPARVDVPPDAALLTCSHCQTTVTLPSRSFEDGELQRCLVCPSRDIYLRKDFPQRLGVLIVVAGFVASSVTWAYSWPIWTFAILFATAFVDVVLYLVMPNALACYHCGAQYRGLPHSDRYSGFDLETHERYRQQKLRLAEHQRRPPAAIHAQARALDRAGVAIGSAGHSAHREESGMAVDPSLIDL
jgi:hypothetical protein